MPEKQGMKEAIGIIELTSIAAGFKVADSMLKSGDVELLLSRTICSGKYMVLVTGETGAIERAVGAGREAADYTLIDDFIIPNVHEKVVPAIRGMSSVRETEALGILESFSVASLIQAADACVKTADVDLIEIRLAMALGGKAFTTLCGSLDDVNSAIDAGAEIIAAKGLLVNKIVIPNPREEVYREIL